MSSTILYKFRSGTTFEALPLPGSAARLFEVKKAIVMAKKLDQGGMEFDLSVRDATTDQEYTKDSELLPRGTRIIVQRLAAAKGHGILAKIARQQYGIATPNKAGPTASAPNEFYTIESRADVDDEFESSEDKELAALRAATDSATDGAGMGPRVSMGYRGAGSGPHMQGPPGAGRGNQALFQGGNRQRLNADPELREQEKQLMPKKRATGIPRTFLNLNAPPATDGSKEGEVNVPLLQPNAIGFEELVHRGGGQSENASGSRRDMDYALKVTATTIPEYLQCAICHNVVKDAMILPWDPEGRTTCETCIRDALTQNGFRCPLTGQEGVSPDDLLANHALRKAAQQFVKEVMEKMEEIEKHHVDDEMVDMDDEPVSATSKQTTLLDDSADKGVVVSKRSNILDKKKRKQDEDDFLSGGLDDFGGDVFAVEAEKPADDEAEALEATEPVESKDASTAHTASPDKKSSVEQTSSSSNVSEHDHHATEPEKSNINMESTAKGVEASAGLSSDTNHAAPTHEEPKASEASQARKDLARRRGPPIGYTMGPAGGAVGARQDPTDSAAIQEQQQHTSYSEDARGRFAGPGGRRPFRGGGRFHDDASGGRRPFRGGGGRGPLRGGRGGAPYRGRGEADYTSWGQPGSTAEEGHHPGSPPPREEREDPSVHSNPHEEDDMQSGAGTKRPRTDSQSGLDESSGIYGEQRYFERNEYGGGGGGGGGRFSNQRGRGRYEGGRFRGGGEGHYARGGRWEDRPFRGRGYRGGRGRY